MKFQKKLIPKSLVTVGATLFVGKFSRFPGTLGSLFALLIWWVISPQSLLNQCLFIGGAVVCAWVSIHFYEKWNRCHDPKEIVIDELVGMWITLLGVPMQASVFIVGFFLFRLFDIWKPFVIGWVDEKVHGAFGTLFDDILAGLLASGVLHLLFFTFW